MKVISQDDFKTIEEVKLNKDGKIIGKIVRYKTKFYYLSPRTDEHYFIKYAGFGVDTSLFNSFITRKFQTDIQRKLGYSVHIEGIIIHYKGKKEKRYYFADLDTWFLKSIDYGKPTVKNNQTETYGLQKILNKKHMTIIAYDKDDYEVVKELTNKNKWNKYKR